MLVALLVMIVLVCVLTAWALVMDYQDAARETILRTELEGAGQRERDILDAIEWDTLYFPVTEPVYRTERSP